MYAIGVDPDLHDTAIAVWEDGLPKLAVVAHVKRQKCSQQDAVVEMADLLPYYMPRFDSGCVGIAVEAQTLQRTGLRQHKRPQDIVVLGNVAGVVLGIFAERGLGPLLHFPTPEEWKGQIPKAVMQARMYDELDWGYEMVGRSEEKGKVGSYALPLRIPKAFSNITKGQWKHVGDAILLARWAYEKRNR